MGHICQNMLIIEICFAVQWYWVIRMWKKWRRSQQAPIVHGLSHEYFAMHATQNFIDRSSAPHAYVKCAPSMGHIRQKKYTL